MIIDGFDINPSSFGNGVAEIIAKSRLAPNEGDGTQLALIGTHPSFSEEELKKFMKSNERITRKVIAEYFGALPRTIQRYMNQVKSVRYVRKGKPGRWEIK